MAEVFDREKKLAIYSGAACERAHASLPSLCERLKAPVGRTSQADYSLEPGTFWNLCRAGNFGKKAGCNAAIECDTLLLFGCDFAWRQYYPQHAPIKQVDIDPTHLGQRHPKDGDSDASEQLMYVLLCARSNVSTRA